MTDYTIFDDSPEPWRDHVDVSVPTRTRRERIAALALDICAERKYRWVSVKKLAFLINLLEKNGQIDFRVTERMVGRTLHAAGWEFGEHRAEALPAWWPGTGSGTKTRSGYHVPGHSKATADRRLVNAALRLLERYEKANGSLDGIAKLIVEHHDRQASELSMYGEIKLARVKRQLARALGRLGVRKLTLPRRRALAPGEAKTLVNRNRGAATKLVRVRCYAVADIREALARTEPK